MTLSLQEILIVGSACEQAKFSELTMDMFRMLQTLEREPMEGTHPMTILGGGMLPMLGAHGVGPLDASPAAVRMPYGPTGTKAYMENGSAGSVGGVPGIGGLGGGVGERRMSRDNPHKYLLYKPSISQLLVFLASGFKELPPGGALLLYISADGCFSTTQHPEDCEWWIGMIMIE